MNSFEGHINNIESSGNLSIITVKLLNDSLIKSIIINNSGTPPEWKIGQSIKTLFKETEVILGGSVLLNISIENSWNGIISKMEQGELMSRLEIDTDMGLVTALIPTKPLVNMELKIKSQVYVMIKLNEVILSK